MTRTQDKPELHWNIQMFTTYFADYHKHELSPWHGLV